MNVKKTIIILFICVVVILLIYRAYLPIYELKKECDVKLGKENFTIVRFSLKPEQKLDTDLPYYLNEIGRSGYKCRPN